MLLLFVQLLACSGGSSAPAAEQQVVDDIPPPPTETAMFQLTVNGGTGSGQYLPGEQVHIFAHVDPYEEVLTGWTASPGTQPPEAEWHWVFTVPEQDVELTPEVAAVEMLMHDIQWAGVEHSKRVFYAIPDKPRGLLFLFHGTQGSADVIAKPSMQTMARLAFSQGYAVAVTEAEERTLQDGGADGKIRWNADPDQLDNIDLQNVSALSDYISEQTEVPLDAPRYALGISNGGAFAVSVGAALDFDAVVSVCGTGRETAWAATQTPTAWWMCANDSNETLAAKRDEWRDGSDNLASRGIATDYDVLQASPMFAERFARIQGIDAAASSAAVAELQANAAIDEQGLLQTEPATLAEQIRLDPASWPMMLALVQSSSASLVEGELKHAWADHQMFDDWAARTMAFFEGAR